jgi:hypothetical protein
VLLAVLAWEGGLAVSAFSTLLPTWLPCTTLLTALWHLPSGAAKRLTFAQRMDVICSFINVNSIR